MCVYVCMPDAVKKNIGSSLQAFYTYTRERLAERSRANARFFLTILF